MFDITLPKQHLLQQWFFKCQSRVVFLLFDIFCCFVWQHCRHLGTAAAASWQGQLAQQCCRRTVVVVHGLSGRNWEWVGDTRHFFNLNHQNWKKLGNKNAIKTKKWGSALFPLCYALFGIFPENRRFLAAVFHENPRFFAFFVWSHCLRWTVRLATRVTLLILWNLQSSNVGRS